MTYPCLVLDHDDTVVNSTATVHYPCFAEYTAKFFPKAKRYTLEEYVLKNFDPGVYDFFHGEVGMTEDAPFRSPKRTQGALPLDPAHWQPQSRRAARAAQSGAVYMASP